jgi:hypothetical protein
MIGERRRLDAELEKENEKEIEREAIEQEKIRKAYDQAFHQQVCSIHLAYLWLILFLSKQMEDYQKFGPPPALKYKGPELDQISLESGGDASALEDFLGEAEEDSAAESDTNSSEGESGRRKVARPRKGLVVEKEVQGEKEEEKEEKEEVEGESKEAEESESKEVEGESESKEV